MTKKEKLFYLLKEYKNGNYKIATFAEEFERIFYYEAEKDLSLDEKLYKILREMADWCGRFSPFEDDLKKYPTVFITEKDFDILINCCIKKLNI